VLGVDNDVLCYERSCDGERFVIALNFGNDHTAVEIAEVKSATALLSTSMDRPVGTIDGPLRPNEGIIFALGSAAP
jgi:hypothetical protein